MKKISLFWILLVLLLESGYAAVHWQEVDKFDDGIQIYVDKSSLKRSGATAQLRHLVLWNEPQEEEGAPPYRSTIVQMGYNCQDKYEQFQSAISYAAAMGKGAVVRTQNEEESSWDSISEGSMEDKLWKIACATQ